VNFSFRRLTDDDLPMLHKWLNEPGIVEWWEGDDVSWEGVVRDYGSQNDEPIEHWIAVLDGRDVGWLDCYAMVDSPEEADGWAKFGMEPDAAGIDYLIADPAERGRGVGTTMITSFVRDVVFGRHPAWSQVCAAPALGNVASWRALQKAGFRRAGIVNGGRLMILDRLR
jgi:aminoglycoside 6'-N-acetyltransferase